MEYYFRGTEVSLIFKKGVEIHYERLPEKHLGLEKVIKDYPEYGCRDILYCKGYEVKWGISKCEEGGSLFGKGLWIIPAYFIFIKAIRNYQ